MKHLFSTLILVFSALSHADTSGSTPENTLATISVNPLRVELSKQAIDSINELDSNFTAYDFGDYTEKVKQIFLADSENLNRETPMVALGYFDCDGSLDMAVMGTSGGKEKILALMSSQGFKASLVPAIPKTKETAVATAKKSSRYISLNQNIPLKATTCRGARKSIDLIQSEESFSGNTHAFYFKNGKWVLYTGQDL